jgi:hypothetical protein
MSGLRTPLHGRNHRPVGWDGPDDPGGSDPFPYALLKHQWVYWGTYPTDPFTTTDSPVWTNSWGNIGGAATPVEPTRFRLAPDDNLETEGSFEGGVSGDPMGTLPAAWWPDYPKVIVLVTTAHVVMAVQIDTDGLVTPYEVLVTGPAGPTGADGLSVLHGAGAPGSGLGRDGEFYIDTTAHAIYGPKTAGAWGASTSLVGPAGAAGAAGGAGANAGLKYTYSTDVANTDPTAGHIKFDTVTLSAVATLRISETDADGNGLAALIQTWDDSTTTPHATITMVKDGVPSNILVFQIAGAITDNGTWDSCAITEVASAGAFVNGDTVRIFFARTGDKGDAGAAGVAGAAGAAGDAGLFFSYHLK